jgi:uncharacterized protein involved in exopolysaccharide biosynthesis
MKRTYAQSMIIPSPVRKHPHPQPLPTTAPLEAAAEDYRVFEPPSDATTAALARNKLLIAICALLLAAAGVAGGVSRGPTYTASATLQVGQVNPNSPGFYSYVASAGALATAFSRAVSAEPVLSTVEEKLGLPAARAVARLSAEPIPQSPVFRVIAIGPSSGDAIRLANVTAAALVAYESKANSASPETASLLGEFSAASLELEHARARLQGLEASTRGRRGAAAGASDVTQAKAARDTAQARLSAIASAYTASVTSQAPRTGLVSLLAGATSASNNRRSQVELLGFVGLLVGLVVGCCLAIARERRRLRPSRVGLNGKTQEPSRP